MGEHPPTTALKTLQVHVSHLRKTLARGSDNGAGGIIVTRYRGYELQLDPERLDSHQFELLAAEGRAELAQGRPDRAATALERALSLWKGPPLVDVAYESFAQREIARLADLRTAALEQLVEAQLELGRHEEVVPQLEALIREHPYRERLRAQLMLALYRCDRQADALQAYHDARRSLLEGLGIEPGERLRELEHAILAQDPTLSVPAAEAAEVPPELDAGTLLAGREAELGSLREHWRGAERGAGRLVLLAGAQGMGKTRLAAELARHVQLERGEVLYYDGAGPLEAARAALAGARDTGRSTLLVVDDLDRAGEEQLGALGELIAALAGLPLLVLATAENPAVGARLRAAATLDLAPLDRDGVLAVAQLYAGGRDHTAIPLEQLAETSGGIPQRVHRVASEWARAEAARRLGAVAARAATSARPARRGGRRARRASSSCRRCVRARGWRTPNGSSSPAHSRAWPPSSVEDAGVFFGRERLVAEMVARLTGAPLMGIVGPSGSGKSSALRAGLLAALADGVLPGSERWALALLRPGEHPLRGTRAGHRRRSRHGTGWSSPSTSSRSSSPPAATRTSARRSSTRWSAALATRAAARSCSWPSAPTSTAAAPPIPSCRACSAPTTCSSGRCAATSCAARSSCPRAAPACRSSPSSSTRCVADVEGEPGALPLLSTSLLELWQHRDGRRLRLAAYEHAGGVHGAVARLAESAYERLDPDRQRTWRAGSCCGSPARARARPCAGACRSPNSAASATSG